MQHFFFLGGVNHFSFSGACSPWKSGRLSLTYHIWIAKTLKLQIDISKTKAGGRGPCKSEI